MLSFCLHDIGASCNKVTKNITHALAFQTYLANKFTKYTDIRFLANYLFVSVIYYNYLYICFSQNIKVIFYQAYI